MLLEVENELYKRVHSTLGQSAVVLRLAEELDQSGRVAEQAMIVVSFASSSFSNPNKGAYIPTVRTRKINFTLTIVQKQTQREGHSFCLPILDLLADSLVGWCPELPGIEWQTGFELESEKFISVTREASQYIYEQTYSIEALLPDGRFFSSPCAAYDPVQVSDFLPVRKCLVTPGEDSRQTGLAVWRRTVGVGEVQRYVVEDVRCGRLIGDNLSVQCTGEEGSGNATYVFVPITAIRPDGTVDNSKVVTGTLTDVWKCTRPGTNSPYPDWFKINLDVGLWRNSVGTIPNTEPETSSYQPLDIGMNKVYNEKPAT
jgi:hypothetical protein